MVLLNITPDHLDRYGYSFQNYVDSKLEAVFDKTKINNLSQCKQIKFVSYLYLPNQPTPIKINEDSYLDLVVHAYLNYNARSK